MHICLDYIPELLAQPDIEKQVCLTTANISFYGFVIQFPSYFNG